MNWIHRNLLKFRFYQNLVERSRHVFIPFLGSVSLYDFLEIFFFEVQKENVFLKSSALAFQFLLAIFPGLIFLLTLIAFIPITNFQQNVMNLFLYILPTDVYLAANETLKEVVIKKNGGLLSFGFLGALYFSTSGMATMISGFHKSTDRKDTRTYFAKRIIALFLTLCLTILLLIAAFIRFAGHSIIKFLGIRSFVKSGFGSLSLTLLEISLVGMLFYIGIAILYYFGPRRKYKRPFFTAGAALAALASLIITEGFAFYVSHFGRYNKIYGSLGTLIVLMGLLYLNSCILLIGYDIELAIVACLRRTKSFQESGKIPNPYKPNSSKPKNALKSS